MTTCKYIYFERKMLLNGKKLMQDKVKSVNLNRNNIVSDVDSVELEEKAVAQL